MLRRPAMYLLALSVASGVVDAVSYLGLGRVFTANMTGNTVLLAVSIANGTTADAARAGAALFGFCLGVASGVALVPEPERRWPYMVRRTLVLEVAALLALLLGWALLGLASARYALIAVSGVAMGAQSAAVRAAHTGGVATTYVTGTLTNAIARTVQLALGRSQTPSAAALPSGVWLVYGIGALAGAFAEIAWHAGAIAVPLAIASCATAIAVFKRSVEPPG